VPGLRVAVLLAVAAAALSATQAVAARTCRLGDLVWMGGIWGGGSGADRSEERWVVAPAGRLMGSSWSLHADRPGGFLEISTIQEDAGHVVLRLRHFDPTLVHARELQDAPMTFIATRCDGASALFDGQGPQAGEHMTYRRDGENLLFVGDFLHDGKPVQVQATMRPAAP
jgi:Domain of unknown function (DUF6265)